MAAVLVLALAALVGTAGDAGATGAGEGVADLVARARVGLAGARAGDRPAERRALAAAEGWLREALGRDPRDLDALLVHGEVLLRTGRPDEAVAVLGRACGLARGPGQVFPCSLRLAAALAQAGQLARALAEYDRHVELGDPRTLPVVHSRAGELLGALGRSPEAQARFAKAIALLERQPAGPERDVELARALYGRAALLDREGHEEAAREVVGRAIGYDPKLELMDLAADPHSGVALVPALEIGYLHGLVLLVLGREREAMAAFKQYAEARPEPRWRARAEAHLLELAAGGADEPLPRQRRARVLAAATLDADGPIPAPLVDAAWRLRPRLIEPCLALLPQSAPAALRVPLVLVLDRRGLPRRVQVSLPAELGFGASSEWHDFTSCVSRRVKAGLRVSRPTRARTTSVRLELVLAIPE